jgi:hypothetical protein
MILITSYYRTDNEKRNEEIDFVLEKNVNSGIFEKIICVCDSIHRPKIESSILEFFSMDRRPTYGDFFSIGNNYRGKIIVLSNSDIFYDGTLYESRNFLKEAGILALTRYEYDTKNETSIMEMGCDSQDSWIYRSPIDISGIDTSFNLGIPGCDNRIAHELSLKYRVINPSLKIKTHHVHESDFRTYDVEKRLKGTYLQINIE